MRVEQWTLEEMQRSKEFHMHFNKIGDIEAHCVTMKRSGETTLVHPVDYPYWQPRRFLERVWQIPVEKHSGEGHQTYIFFTEELITEDIVPAERCPWHS